VRHCRGRGLRWLAPRRAPVGARVPCGAGHQPLVRWLRGGPGYPSAHDPRLWFGLAASTGVDQLEIRWPSGAIQSWADLPADRILNIEEENPDIGDRPAGDRAGPTRSR